MSNCFFSLTEAKNRCLRSTFTKSGLRSAVTDLGEGTLMHCWVPGDPARPIPNVILIHGLGGNALWQWADVVPRLAPHFNLYVPDLVFFGGSHTSSPERGERFQARCVMRAVEAHWAGAGAGARRRASVVGLSYGGFVAYSMAAQFGEAVERVVICGAGVCMEERDLREGLFKVSDLEVAAEILVPQTPSPLRDLVGYTFFRPLPLFLLPSCLLNNFINAMCRDYVEEKRDLIRCIPKNRELSDLPKILQPTLIIWGEHDQVFPLELAHRLKRHLGDTAQLVVIKNSGHAFNVEKPKEFLHHLKSFLIAKQPPLSDPQKSNPQMNVDIKYC